MQLEPVYGQLSCWPNQFIGQTDLVAEYISWLKQFTSRPTSSLNDLLAQPICGANQGMID